jgi:hypothetical protein
MQASLEKSTMLKSIQTNCSFIDELTLTNKLREETTRRPTQWTWVQVKE